MKISKDARALSRQLLRSSFTNGRIDQAKVKALVAHVIAKRPRGYVGGLENFSRMLRLELAKRHAVVESAEPLDTVATHALTENLRAKHGDDITTEYQTNPALLGGLRITLGSDVWDGTVKARLDRLAASL
ncbi:MAG: F0F1 ATP synthase subunit delta [Verrucomicrobia bacterium]|nr:F0F1 ATP synthase subunit delta [Verrucomicrobiota bacterium]